MLFKSCFPWSRAEGQRSASQSSARKTNSADVGGRACARRLYGRARGCQVSGCLQTLIQRSFQEVKQTETGTRKVKGQNRKLDLKVLKDPPGAEEPSDPGWTHGGNPGTSWDRRPRRRWRSIRANRDAPASCSAIRTRTPV